MEEDEDRVLLNSLGVESANPECIERDVLAEARNDVETSTKVDGSSKEESAQKSENVDPSSTSKAELYHKLRAVDFEINAVASTIQQVRNVESNGDYIGAGDENQGQWITEDNSSNDLNLQHVLTADRLASLKKTKTRLEKELSDLFKEKTSKSINQDKVIFNLVKEEPRSKRKPKEVQKLHKSSGKRHKTVSFNDDVNFDAVLDAASAGFVETERDQLVRKGILTPFSNLKGFERRFQQSETSSSYNASQEEKTDDLASSSFERAAQSISEAARARPTTKLLESEDLPKLDAPTHPFVRLRVPLKLPQSQEREVEKKKILRRQKRRPLPGRKWIKHVSSEEIHSRETGMFNVLIA